MKSIRLRISKQQYCSDQHCRPNPQKQFEYNMIRQFTFYVLFLVGFQHFGFTQNNVVKAAYVSSYDTLYSLLKNPSKEAFEKAVFITENAYALGEMNYVKFDAYIEELTGIIMRWLEANPIKEYHYSDSINFLENFGIYKFLKDTIYFVDKDQQSYKLLPYTYDFTDFFGRKDWGYMFVTKLLATKKGNCHSLPYLYKILADKIGAQCWLALAPNHIYIENRCKKIGWYNTELTSGEFPTDAWIMGSGYIPVEAIQNGIYMDTLSYQESIALCVLDLAKGYEHKTRDYTDGFILKCCDLSLKYFPFNVQAMLLKAETLKRIYERQKLQEQTIAKKTYSEMQSLYLKLFDLGYREMPDQMYIQWLQSVVKERDRYTNRAVKEISK
jgi:hypothetical protein